MTVLGVLKRVGSGGWVIFASFIYIMNCYLTWVNKTRSIILNYGNLYCILGKLFCILGKSYCIHGKLYCIL